MAIFKSLRGSAPKLLASLFFVFGLIGAFPLTALALVDANDGIPPEVILQRSSLGTRDAAGAFTYDIPITVPPGRSGLQPDLKLTYNNRESEINNLFGYGWSLNVPYIQRLNKRGVENLYTDYFFFSTLDGELATTTASTTSSFAPVVENGAFNSYTFSNNVWTVYDKKGTRFSFGTTTTSRLDNVASSTQVYTWYLEEVRDTNDNYIKYEYDKDTTASSTQLYPSRITYTGNGSTDGIFKVEFARTSRSDTATSSAPGFNVMSKQIINQIDVKTNDVLTRRYSLSHITGNNGTRLLISSVTESGYTEAGATTTLPATTFNYSTSTKSWTQNSSYTIPIWFSRDRYDQGMRLGDVNGDGLPDLIKSSYHNTDGTIRQVYVHKGDGTGWALDGNYSVPNINFVYNEVDQGVFLDDINGDGFVDILQSYTDGGGTNYESVYVNKKDGTGWNLVSTTSIPVLFLNNRTYQGVRTADVNGDGLTDLLQSYNDNLGTTVYGTYLGNGDGTWTQNNNYSIPVDFQLGTGDVGTRLVDINNDGLTDILQSYQNCSSESTSRLYLNKGDGTGWTLISTTTPQVQFTVCNQDKGVRIIDVNGDSLLDFVTSYNNSSNQLSQGVQLNKGNGAWGPDDAYSFNSDYFTYNGTEYGTRVVDIDGDGLSDIIRSYKLEGTGDVQRYNQHNGIKADLLNYITLPEGGSITVSYKNSTKYTDSGTGKPINRELPLVLTTADAIARNDGFGTVSTTTYAYGGGAHYFNSILDRKFAGFATTTITDAAGNVTKEFRHQGNATLSSIGEYSDHISKAGKTYRTEQYDGSNNLYKKTVAKWDRHNQGTNRDFVHLLRTIEYLYDGDSDHRDKAEEFWYATSTTGNLVQKVAWGEVTGSDDGTFTDTGNDKFVQDFSYSTTSVRNLIGLPATETLNDQSGTKVSEKRHYYDNLSLGSISIGNETKTEFWKSSSNYASTTKTFNGYGLVTQERDPLYKLTTYVYDAFNLYPATTTNPLSQTIQRTYDYSSGKVKVTTDPNGRQFETTYDGFDRSLEEKQPNLSSPGSLVTKKAYTYTDTSGAKKVLETNYLDGSANFTVHTYFDGLNRKMQVRKEAENSSEFAVRDFTYNNLGLAYRDSLPYFGGGSSRTTATTTISLYTTYLYDALKRVNAIGNAVGTTTTAYDQWTATTTDANSNQKGLTNDAYGNLAQVLEKNGSSNYTTTYTYNGLNKLTKITDALGNIRNFTYDGIGRRLTAEDLHAVGDGTYGTWTYTYDDAGNVTSQVDPKSQTVNFTYDDLNRPLTEDYTGGTGTEITYTYDSCTEGVGRLCSAVNLNSATTTYAYNTLGGIATTTKTIAGSTFATGVSYDRQANPLVITHPNFAQTIYAYNTAGLLENVQFRDTSTSSVATLVSNINYAPTEQTTYRVFGNDTETILTYDAEKLYRLVNIRTVATTTGAGGGGGTGSGGLALLKARSMFYALKNIFPSLLVQETLSDAIAPATDVASTTLETISPIPLTETSTTTISTLEPVATTTEPIATPTAPESLSTTASEPSATTTAAIGSEVASTTPAVPQLEIATTTPQTLIQPEIATTTATSTPSILGKIGEMLVGKTANERATIKGIEISKLVSIPHTKREQMDIEVVSMEAIEGGVQVFARAWDSAGKQYGFGQDGSVDIERFRIFNPPVLVPDPQGLVVQTWEDLDGKVYSRSLREDPKEALLQVLEETIKVKQEKFTDSAIVPEKVGRTTSTFYTETGDGRTGYINTSTWSEARGGTTPNATNYTSASVQIGSENETGPDYANIRGFFPFNTSALPDTDTINSATFSIWPHTATGYSFSTGLIKTTQATSSEVVADDYQRLTLNNPAEGSARLSVGSTTGAYANYSLNSTGLGWITATSTTFLGVRFALDIDNATPTLATRNYILVYAVDQVGTANDPKLVVEHTLPNSAPSAPSSLLTEGRTNPDDIADVTPEFSAIYNDPNDNDQANYYQIQVATSSSYWGAPLWDSGQHSMATTTKGSRSPDVSYAGSTLSGNTTYYWRIKFWDTGGLGGDWSTATSSFKLRTTGGLQNLSFSYDSVGNITEIFDTSDTSTNKAVAYTYDALNRLTLASTTAATSTPYRRAYTYDAIGNITTASDLGAYAYSGSGYYNPHAVTGIGDTSTTTYAYDNNGNLTSAGSWTYTWDYRNRLTQASNGSPSTYSYDHTGQRVKKVFSGATTLYPDKTYNLKGATTTIHVYDASGGLLASIEGNGTATTSQYIYTDHLGGSHIVANRSGTIVETTDYYPYGDQRIETGTFDEQRKFTGHEFDTESDLTYANARYYEQDIAKFLSQDPVFWEVAQTEDGKSVLSRPQLQNSYSYAGNNPITQKDPTGRYAETAFDAAMFVLSLNAYRDDPSPGNAIGVLLDGASLALPVPAIGGALIRGVNRADNAARAAKVANWGNPSSLKGHFERHGADFGAKSPADYAQQATDFLKNADSGGYLRKVDNIGVTRIYDPKTNTFGSYNKDGTTKTYFKPDSSTYFDRQPGKSLSQSPDPKKKK